MKTNHQFLMARTALFIEQTNDHNYYWCRGRNNLDSIMANAKAMFDQVAGRDESVNGYDRQQLISSAKLDRECAEALDDVLLLIKHGEYGLGKQLLDAVLFRQCAITAWLYEDDAA